MAQQITSNVYAETGFRGCNPGFVVTREGVVMVDAPQRLSDALAWREEIAKHGRVRYLINTEPHGDHWTSDYLFPGPVVAHQGTREAILASDPAAMKERLAQTDPEGLKKARRFRIKAPSLTFSQRLTLYLGDHTFELLHLPGHTSSQTAVFIPQERVVFTGDNISHRVMPFLQAADVFAWLDSLKRLEGLDARVVVPGHGTVCDKGYLPQMAAVLQEAIEAVRGALQKGMSKEEAAGSITLWPQMGMDVGLEEMAARVRRMGVERLYDQLSPRR
ncbi:MAG: MBL fold metallo-hydrolase [Chloroflexi bacterium]|nr:MBL fold metallo-hydrolase [Chloroflexota bacterium]